MPGITGLHHVTAIAGDAQENLDFYAGVLGMRLVKRSVNQDVPGTYHLFYADGAGTPGTDLTFFPWPDLPQGRRGNGLAVEVALAVPVGSLEFWRDRLAAHRVASADPVVRFGESTLTFADPHGLGLALTETADGREFAPWAEGPVAPAHQIRGLHGVRLFERALGPTAAFLTGTLGFTKIADEEGWTRLAAAPGGSGRVIDIQEQPGVAAGTWGTGSVHHVAWRVPDDATELTVRSDIQRAGRSPTGVIDRFWFKSVYFKEPGGTLFEVATDGPGFAEDEPLESLGSRLVLPPWLEDDRASIESALPPLREPASSASSDRFLSTPQR